ncbi:MAG: hypothetical protein ABL962_10260 [Fimbriimonadaceae bacterium]
MRVRTHRLPVERYKLLQALKSAAHGAASDPNWPVATIPPGDLVTLAQAFEAEIVLVGNHENNLRGEQAGLRMTMDNVTTILKRVDAITTAIYGESGGEKGLYGIRPIDRTRNQPPPPLPVLKLILTDGPEPGTILAKWKAQPRATYQVDWSLHANFNPVIGSSPTTRANLTFPAQIGARVFVRVRAYRGGRWSEWSEPLSRYVN